MSNMGKKKKDTKENMTEYKAEAEIVEVEILDISERLCNVIKI